MDSEDEAEAGAPPPAVPAVVVQPSAEAEGDAPPLTARSGGDIEAPPPDTEGGGEDDSKGPVVSSFLVKEQGRVANAIFVPDQTRLNAQKLQALLTQWKLEPPSTMISCDAGTVHPSLFGAIGLAKLKSFEQFWADAQKHAVRTGADEAQAKEDFALKVINDVIFLKLKTIFSAILDAAGIAGNWIVIDRTAAKSPAAELLLEAAMQQTPSRPVILCIDSIDRLKKFKGPNGDGPLDAGTQKCLKALDKCKKIGIPFGVDDPIPQETLSQFYDPDEFMDASVFYDKELPRPPEPAHVLPDGSLPDRVKWQYHYLATFPGAGTHYIVLDTAHDAPDLGSLGPFGYVVANGQGMMVDRLKSRISGGEPLVMLHNTGGVTQAFASLRKAMLATYTAPEPSELLEKLELVSPAAWTKAFGLPEILMLKELHQRAPMLLHNTLVSVDVMKDTSEDVLQTLTCCFAGGGGVPELGLGEAEMLCVMTAWKRSMILWENAKKFEQSADFIQLFLYVLGIITTVLAVMFSLENADAEKLAALEAQAAEMSAAVEQAAAATRRSLAICDSDIVPTIAPAVSYAVYRLLASAGNASGAVNATLSAAHTTLTETISKAVVGASAQALTGLGRMASARRLSEGAATADDAAAADAAPAEDAAAADEAAAATDDGAGAAEAGGDAPAEAAAPAGSASPAEGILSDKTPLGLTMILLPILAALVGTYRTKTRPREKWATCLMASHQLVDQIYKYRMRTDMYDTQAAPPSNGDEEAPEISPKMRETMARLTFVATCTEVYSFAISTEVGKGSALRMSKTTKLQTQYDGDRAIFHKKLKRHVHTKLYGKKRFVDPEELQQKLKDAAASKAAGAAAKKGLLGFFGKKKNQIAASPMGALGDALGNAAEAVGNVVGDVVGVSGDVDAKAFDMEGGAKEQEEATEQVDDLVSQIAVETYMDCRVRPLVDYLEWRAPQMQRRGMLLEITSMLANSAGAILAVLGRADFVAITVAVAATAMALMDYFYIDSQLAATNRAVEQCHNLLIWYDSLSMVQRKTRQTKLKCASLVEGAILALCASRTATSPALPSQQGGDEEEGEEEKK